MDDELTEICEIAAKYLVVESMIKVEHDKEYTNWDLAAVDFVCSITISYFTSMRKNLAGDFDQSEIDRLITLFYDICKTRSKNALGESLRRLRKDS